MGETIKYEFLKRSKLIIVSIAGVMLLTTPIAEAKELVGSEKAIVSVETVNNSTNVFLDEYAATLSPNTKNYEKLKEFIASDVDAPKPSFEMESNTALLTEATLLNSEADKLSAELDTTHDAIKQDLEELKQLVVGKKAKELAEAEELAKEQDEASRKLKTSIKIAELKATNPNANIQVTHTLKDFVAQAKEHHFENYDVRTPSNLTAQELESFVAGTELEGLGETYYQAEQQHGINAFVVLALSAHESAWGKSRLAREKNNIFGYMAYDRDPYNSAKDFASKGEGVLVVANHLATNYLKSGGKYFNGYTLKGMNVMYASDMEWNSKITSIMNSLVFKAN